MPLNIGLTLGLAGLCLLDICVPHPGHFLALSGTIQSGDFQGLGLWAVQSVPEERASASLELNCVPWWPEGDTCHTCLPTCMQEPTATHRHR